MEKAESILKPEPVSIPAGISVMKGDLVIPEKAKGLVLFVHGSGSSRLSPRNRHVASLLQEGNLATLLFDLLTDEEENVDLYTRQFRFDIGLLTRRLVSATEWASNASRLKKLKMGYFGASTGAAAAIRAASLMPDLIHAVVSRGGRPDLAGENLSLLRSPILLIVGEQDDQVIQLNTEAMQKIHCEKQLEIIPGATHLFEEPGALDHVAGLARTWFQRLLG